MSAPLKGNITVKLDRQARGWTKSAFFWSARCLWSKISTTCTQKLLPSIQVNTITYLKGILEIPLKGVLSSKSLRDMLSVRIFFDVGIGHGHNLWCGYNLHNPTIRCMLWARNRANLARRNRHIFLSLLTPVFSCTHRLHPHHFPLSLTALTLVSSLPCCSCHQLEQLESGHSASWLGGYAGNDGPWQTFPHQELCPQAPSQPRSKNKYCVYVISCSSGTGMFPLGLIGPLLSQTEPDTCI